MTRHAERPHYAIGVGSFTYERLSSSFPGNVLRSVIIHEPPGYRSEPIAHEGEEIFFVLDGALTVEVDGERVVLEAGDSIHFQSTRVHSTWNHTIRPATILHTCTMDVFGDGAGRRRRKKHGRAQEQRPEKHTETTQDKKGEAVMKTCSEDAGRSIDRRGHRIGRGNRRIQPATGRRRNRAAPRRGAGRRTRSRQGDRLCRTRS